MKMNRILVLLSVAAMAFACTREEMPANLATGGESANLVTFDVGFSIPTGESPATKAMDDATPVIKNIYIAVFGSNNYLNEFVKAVPLTSAGGAISLEGGEYKYVKDGGVYNVRFSLKPTTSKRYVHVLANVPEGNTPPDFGYVDEVMGKNLYTENDEDGYWQYLEFPSGIDGTSATTSRFNGLKLVRNFAKVSLDPGTNFTLVGFELYDTPTRGSFAAYTGKEVSGGDVTYNFYSGWVDAGDPTSYATVKAAYSGYLMPGATPLHRPESPTWTNTSSKFTYEHPASEDNPTFIVAKLTRKSDPITTKYYRLDILDNNGHKSPLLRNYHYTVKIDNISSSGFDTPEKALENPSDYNFTLSEESRDAYEIENNGAYMEVEYVEKVFTKAQSDVPFKYRYTADMSASPRVYSEGKVSAVSGEGEVKADWASDTAGAGPDEGWYTVTYDVNDPANIGSDELVSSFYVTAGESKQMIQRRIDIVSMKKKQLTVTEWSLSGTTLTLTFTVPDGLRQSMFPIQFKFEAYDITTNKQILSPQTEGLISDYTLTSTGSVIYSLEDYFYSDYTAVGGKSITVVFKSPSAVKPEVILSDLNDYFEPLDLGGSFATGLAANAIAKGTGHTTTLDFRAATTAPMTLTLTKLTATEFDDTSGTLTKTGESGDTYTYSYVPKSTGDKSIELTATTNDEAGTAAFALFTPDPTNYPNDPDPLTVGRYDKYVTGALTQAAELPLGTGQSTTFSFNYSARDLMPVTISAPNVEIWSADGSSKLSDTGTYTYTPAAKGTQTFTITSKTNLEDAGTISLSMPYMTNPDPLTVKRATKIVIPAGNLILDEALHFSTPMYWRTNEVHSTSGVAGSSEYFNADSSGDGSNTGTISIDISSFDKADSTPVYFMYTYTERILIFIPITRYKFASLTLSQLLSAAAGTPQTLTF